MATNRSSVSSLETQFPAWRPEYEAVLSETDTRALFECVEVAEAAILTRREVLEQSPGHPEELRAIGEALGSLRVIKTERLRFRVAERRH
jgi:hypothetical protein